MSLIYFRHASDNLEEGIVAHRHDPHLNTTVMRNNYRKIVRVMNEHNAPDVIYCSPFNRTIETTQIIVSAAKQLHHKDVEVIIDPSLSRYFNSSEQQDPSVSSRTEELNAPIKEKKINFEKRILEHYQRVKLTPGKNIWCVTHALVYKRLAAYHHKIVPQSNIPFLHHFVV